MARTAPAADELLLGFTRALRAAGLAVTADRARAYADAVAVVGLDDRRATYWAGRATLCRGPDDFAPYDRVFCAWFEEAEPPLTERRQQPPQHVLQAPLDDDGGAGGGDGEDDALHAVASDVEVLRHRDVAQLDAAERARLARMFASLRPTTPTRTSYRRRPANRGSVDPHATLRRSLAQLGEPVEIRFRRRSTRPRRTVLLIDVSGSMSSYADALLRLGHRIVTAEPARTEVFTVGTRVTRLTEALRHRDPERALMAAGATVPDWSGGTRLGEALKVFLDRWGQRGMARGAVVVLMSDGWERGDAALLGEQMARLRRLAHKVVWANPHKGIAGYQPVQVGMAAALPHVDEFVAGHSMAAFEQLVRVIGDA
ncbi:vWA domain-containing protein [Nocardioides caldifontis]|uniref:vWA domain-containing protein n=1 Tax=Nocardioides caldifontis TaxID=2588938 RepID=UPI0011DF9A07|nr:VWA domain-containing protein [Nocardioides caldifontis]